MCVSIVNQASIRLNVSDVLINSFNESKSFESFLSEFKAFALKGNVMDLAVVVIIGATF